MLCVDELGVAVVDDFINYFVDEHEVLADAFLVEHAAVVAEDLHHAVEDVDHCTGLHILLRGRYKVNAELLREEVIHSVYILWGQELTRDGALTKAGGGSPGQNFTFLKNTSVVCRPKSYLTEGPQSTGQNNKAGYLQSLLMIESPLVDRMKNCDNIFVSYYN